MILLFTSIYAENKMDRTRGKGTALTARQKKQQFREKKYKKDSLGTKKEGKSIDLTIYGT